MQGQCCHVVAKDDLFRPRGIEKICHCGVGLVQHLIGSATGLEQPFVIGVMLKQIPVDAVQALLCDLRACGVIQKYGWPVERGELLADKFAVENHIVSWLSKMRIMRWRSSQPA